MDLFKAQQIYNFKVSINARLLNFSLDYSVGNSFKKINGIIDLRVTLRFKNSE